MSISPTEDALVVALDFEGEMGCIAPGEFKIISDLTQQVSIVWSVPLRRTRFSFFSILLFRIL